MKYSFFIIVFIIFITLITYTIFRGCQVLRETLLLRNIYLTLTISLFVLLVGAFLTNVFTIPCQKTIALIGYTGLIIFLYLMLSFFITDIVRLANYFFRFSNDSLFFFRKIAFICSIAVIAICLIVGNYKFKHPKIVHLDIVLENKILSNPSLRIVMVSDLHLGVTIDRNILEQYVSYINTQNPDVVLMVGDVFDSNSTPVIRQNMHEVLQKIKAPFGVFAVLGNHEYIGNQTDLKIKYLEKSNIAVLRDSTIFVDSLFYLVGRDDRSNHHRKQINELLQGLDRRYPIIMLDHQPYNLKEAEQNGIDLQLSGHTHDGQFFPINLIVKTMYEQAHGYLQRNSTYYYVSSGLGLWGAQYRIGSQSELVVIDLSGKKQ